MCCTIVLHRMQCRQHHGSRLTLLTHSLHSLLYNKSSHDGHTSPSLLYLVKFFHQLSHFLRQKTFNQKVNIHEHKVSQMWTSGFNYRRKKLYILSFLVPDWIVLHVCKCKNNDNKKIKKIKFLCHFKMLSLIIWTSVNSCTLADMYIY